MVIARSSIPLLREAEVSQGLWPTVLEGVARHGRAAHQHADRTDTEECDESKLSFWPGFC